MTTHEPRWTDQDRAEALALSLYRQRSCPCGCGNPAAQTLVPEGLGPDWVVEETTCTARFALLEQQRAAAEARGASFAKNAPASLWLVRPRKR